ncbi:hypothetical protein Bca52824_095899, partial [Brassica carinata]
QEEKSKKATPNLRPSSSSFKLCFCSERMGEGGDTGGRKTTEEMKRKAIAETIKLQRRRLFIDIAIPIMQELPPTRLARFLAVDTEWRETISSERFEKEYLSRAEKKPKILFVSTSDSKTDETYHHMFRSLLKKADESSKLPLTLRRGATLRSDVTYQISQSIYTDSLLF